MDPPKYGPDPHMEGSGPSNPYGLGTKACLERLGTHVQHPAF